MRQGEGFVFARAPILEPQMPQHPWKPRRSGRLVKGIKLFGTMRDINRRIFRCSAHVLQSHHLGTLQLNQALVRQTGSQRCIKLAVVDHNMATRQPTLCKRVQLLRRLLQCRLRQRQRQLPVHSWCYSNSAGSDTPQKCHTKVNRLLLIYTMRQTNLGAWAFTKPSNKYRVLGGWYWPSPPFVRVARDTAD